VTPHAIRHSVANFIVASAPEEAALASIILNHRSDATTPTYTQRADQIVASRRLRAATRQMATDLSADISPTRSRQKKSHVRSRPRSSKISKRQ
jgi:integrase